MPLPCPRAPSSGCPGTTATRSHSATPPPQLAEQPACSHRCAPSCIRPSLGRVKRVPTKTLAFTDATQARRKDTLGEEQNIVLADIALNSVRDDLVKSLTSVRQLRAGRGAPPALQHSRMRLMIESNTPLLLSGSRSTIGQARLSSRPNPARWAATRRTVRDSSPLKLEGLD